MTTTKLCGAAQPSIDSGASPASGNGLAKGWDGLFVAVTVQEEG
jgi:hypothetical protein